MHILLLKCSHLLVEDKELKKLKSLFPEIDYSVSDENSYTLDQLSNANIIVGFPKVDDLKKAKNLIWLHTPSSGIEDYAKSDIYFNKDIIVTRSTGVYGRQIANHAMGMIYGLVHSLFIYRDQMKSKKWLPIFPVKDLWESTILIVGFGDIGNQIAIRAKASQMKVIAIKRTLTEKPNYVDELYEPNELDNLIPRADFIVLSTPYTSETKDMFNAKRLGLMKKGSYIINVSRGQLIDQEALIKNLELKHIGGAGLDVTHPEPLPEDSKLWSFENVLISPHASGLSYSDPHLVFELFLENLKHFMSNKLLMKNKVNFNIEY
jgi:phosphoglycerate dehydrogenase-like enzyme